MTYADFLNGLLVTYLREVVLLDTFVEENYKDVLKIICTKPMYKDHKYFKIVIEKKEKGFHISKYYDTKVDHENIEGNPIEFLRGYKDINLFTHNSSYNILTNKKGNTKINKLKNHIEVKVNKSHNKDKNYILKEMEQIDFLIHLGVMNKDGKVFANKQKKFKQINKFLEMIKDIEENVSPNSTIIDIGSGKSYLTFAIYYYFNVIKNKSVSIIGLDLKQDVVSHCNNIAKELNYNDLNFQCIDIKDFVYEKHDIDLVVSLHACDTATDFSIYNGIKWNAKVILAVPCCQHEVFPQIASEDLSDILKHGILKERLSAMVTDAMRSSLMESSGYKTNIMEFIDMEHTPKNIMIRGIKNNKKTSYDDYLKLKKIFSCDIELYRLLKANNYIDTTK